MFQVYSRKVKLCGLAAMLTLAFGMSPVLSGTASADFGLCRTDPVVVLSNGVVVDLTTSVSDVVPDVKQIAYTVHVPAGVTLVKLYTTPGPLTRVETVQVLADNNAGTYDTATTVRTGALGVPVTATTAVVDLISGTLLGYDSASGTSSQTLVSHLVVAGQNSADLAG